MRLLSPAIATALIALGLPAVAEVDAVDPQHHKLCLEARDYAGCIKAMSGSKNEEQSSEKCWDRYDCHWCIAQKGIDTLGMPKLP